MNFKEKLHRALVAGKYSLVRKLLSEASVLDQLPTAKWNFSDFEAPFHQAAFLGLNDILELFLDAGVDINCMSGPRGKHFYCTTALHEAIRGNRRETATFLLQRGSKTSINSHCPNS